MSNHHIQLEASFGVPVAGGMLHALNPHLPADALAHIINHAQDRFLIVDDVLLPAFERIKGRVNIERVIVAPFKGGSSCHRYEEYEDLLHDSGEPNVADLDEMEPAVVCYTLGAAAGLEADVYTHRTITLHAYSISRPDDLSIGRSDTILPAVPMFHEHGWGLPYAAVMRGSRLILPGPHLQPERMLDLLSAHRVTLTGAGLTLWLDCARRSGARTAPMDAHAGHPHRRGWRDRTGEHGPAFRCPSRAGDSAAGHDAADRDELDSRARGEHFFFVSQRNLSRGRR